MFVIDAVGRVVAANRSAGELLGGGGKSLIGTSFPSLFSFGAEVPDEGWVESEWKTFRSSALDRWSSYPMKQAVGSRREVRVRLERAVGGAGSYIAMIRPHGPHVPEPLGSRATSLTPERVAMAATPSRASARLQRLIAAVLKTVRSTKLARPSTRTRWSDFSPGKLGATFRNA